MSDTPRTDLEMEELYDGHTCYAHVVEAVPIDFARKLELENAELRKAKERLDWLIGDGGTIYTNRGLGYISLSGNEDYRADIDEAMKGESL